MNTEEEGLKLSVGTEGKTVIVNFHQPVCWIGMDKFTALSVAKSIMDCANRIEDYMQ